MKEHTAVVSALEFTAVSKETAVLEVSGKVSELESTVEELKAAGAEKEAALQAGTWEIEWQSGHTGLYTWQYPLHTSGGAYPIAHALCLPTAQSTPISMCLIKRA